MNQTQRIAALPLAALLFAAGARAQDRVFYRDHASGKELTASGRIEAEDAAKIVLRSNTGPREIPARDVRDVIYGVGSPQARVEWSSAANDERRATAETSGAAREKALASALAKYEELQKSVTEPNARAQLEFSMARLTALRAQQDPEAAKLAITRLADFHAKHPAAWQTTACLRLLARLQLRAGDPAEAVQTYEALAATPGLDKETAQDSELKVADLLVHAKKYSQAEEKLKNLLQATAGDDAATARVQIALAACQAARGKLADASKALETLIRNTRDPALKALAYNTLGDCYRQAGQLEDAKWQYLFVDVVYHQDREEHARALYNLYKVFKELKDDAKATQFRDQLEKDKDLAGSEYRRLLETDR